MSNCTLKKGEDNKEGNKSKIIMCMIPIKHVIGWTSRVMLKFYLGSVWQFMPWGGQGHFKKWSLA